MGSPRLEGLKQGLSEETGWTQYTQPLQLRGRQE